MRFIGIRIVWRSMNEFAATVDSLLNETENDLLFTIACVPNIDQSIRGHASKTWPAFQQDDFRTVSRRAVCGRNARRPSTAYNYICLCQYGHPTFGHNDILARIINACMGER